jgi:hypothetical protein
MHSLLLLWHHPMALDSLAEEIVDSHTRCLALYHWGELLLGGNLVVAFIFV